MGQRAMRVEFNANAAPEFIEGVLRDLMKSIAKHDTLS
jgi:hypothetical protein